MSAHPARQLIRRRWRWLASLVGLIGVPLVPLVWAAPGNNSTATPYRSLYAASSPVGAVDTDTSAVTLGVRFTPRVDGWVDSVEFYRGSTVNTARTVSLWSATGAKLASGQTANATTTGWVWGRFNTPVHVTADQSYVVSYLAPAGRYNAISGGFTSGRTVGPLTTRTDAGVYTYAASEAFPTQVYGHSEYLVSPVFVADVAAAPSPPGPNGSFGNPTVVNNNTSQDNENVWGTKYAGEQFTVPHDVTISRLNVAATIKNMQWTTADSDNLPQDDLRVHLEDTSGNVIDEGVLLAASAVRRYSDNWYPTMLHYNMTNTKILQAGKTYRLWVSSPRTTAVNAYLVNVAGSTYDGANSVSLYGDGSQHPTAWSTDSSQDLAFTITTGPFVQNLHPDFVARLGMKMYLSFVGDLTDTGRVRLVGPAGSQTLFEAPHPLDGHERVFGWNMRSLPRGDYTLITELVNSTGQVKTSRSETFSKPYDGVPVVGIDENNGIFVHGQPKFLVSMYHAGLCHSTALNCYLDWADAGYVNSDLGDNHWGYPTPYTPNDWGAFLTNLPAGHMAMGPNATGANESDAQLAQWIDAAKDKPSFAMHHWFDEPDLNGPNPAQVRRYTDVSHRLDPQHPVADNYMGGYMGGSPWGRSRDKAYTWDLLEQGKPMAQDVVSQDFYPVGSYYNNAQSLQSAWDTIPNIYAYGRLFTHDLAPILSFVEAVNIDVNKPKPTGQQVWNEVWLNIIGGSKTIEWFQYFGSSSPDIEQYLKKTVDYTTALAPQLMSADSDKAMRRTVSGSGRIDCLVKEYAGKLYIFAANRDVATSGTAEFSLNGFAGRTVSVYGENRTMTVANGAFQDTFAPYAVHIYQVI